LISSSKSNEIRSIRTLPFSLQSDFSCDFRPTTLELRSDERYDTQLTRKASDRGNSKGIVEVSSVEQMAQIVSSYAGQLDEFFRAQSDPQPVEKAAVVDETETVIVEN